MTKLIGNQSVYILNNGNFQASKTDNGGMLGDKKFKTIHFGAAAYGLDAFHDSVQVLWQYLALLL